jgi:hypothetical protein
MSSGQRFPDSGHNVETQPALNLLVAKDASRAHPVMGSS